MPILRINDSLPELIKQLDGGKMTEETIVSKVETNAEVNSNIAEVDGFTFNKDIKKWKIKDQIAFIDAIQQNDVVLLGKAFPAFANMVVAWPYEYDPSNPESFGELDGYQFEAMLTALMSAFQPNK